MLAVTVPGRQRPLRLQLERHVKTLVESLQRSGVQSLAVEDAAELFEGDARARRLAELLVSEPDVRLVVINTVLRDVAKEYSRSGEKRDPG